MYGDPAGVRRLAQRVLAEAERTAADASQAAGAADVAWESVRAGRFRAELAGSVDVVVRAAAELEELERLLLAHAQAAQERLEQIAAAQRWMHEQAEAARDRAVAAERAVERKVADLRQLAVSAVHTVVDTVGALVDRGLDVAERAVDEARDVARDAAAESDRWWGPMRSLSPGELRWVETARSMGWSG